MNMDIMRQLFPKAMANIDAGLCATCGKPVGEFRDELSKKEFKISGMCQICQNSVFDQPEEAV